MESDYRLKEMIESFDISFPNLIKNIFDRQIPLDDTTRMSKEIYSRIIPAVWELLKSMLLMHPTDNLISINVLFRSYIEHWALVNYMYFKSQEDPEVFKRYHEFAYDYERTQIEIQNDIKSLPEIQTRKKIKEEYIKQGKNCCFDRHLKSFQEFSFIPMCKYMDKVQSNTAEDNYKWYKLFLYVIGQYSSCSSFVHAGPVSIFYFDLLKSHDDDFNFEIKNQIEYALMLFDQMTENVFKFTNSGNLAGTNILSSAIYAFRKKIIELISKI